MTDSQPLKRRKCYYCQDKYFPAFQEQRLCNDCRTLAIKKQSAIRAREDKRERTEAGIALEQHYSERNLWDIQIIDERGDVVWARDLAKRYRNELDARMRGEFRVRQSKSSVQNVPKNQAP
jgi:hypothetical protein